MVCLVTFPTLPVKTSRGIGADLDLPNIPALVLHHVECPAPGSLAVHAYPNMHLHSGAIIEALAQSWEYHGNMIRKRFKKAWRDPVKGKSPNPETLAIEGSFEKFTADMKNLFSRNKTEKKQSGRLNSQAGE